MLEPTCKSSRCNLIGQTLRVMTRILKWKEHLTCGHFNAKISERGTILGKYMLDQMWESQYKVG